MRQPYDEWEFRRGDPQYGDQYDLFGDVIKVHSEKTVLNSDVILSHLTDDVVAQKVPIFIREMLKNVILINDYIQDKPNGQPNPYKEKIATLLFKDPENMIIISRSSRAIPRRVKKKKPIMTKTRS